MPVSVSYPGVYIQEVSSGVRTITGVSTSVALFMGMVSRGPLNVPKSVLSFADYERTFGSDTSVSEMTDQVRLFFQNGGQTAYIMRIAQGAQQAQVTVNNEFETPVVTFVAKEYGVIGNSIRITVDYNTARPETTFNLRVFREVVANGSIQFIETETHRDLSMNPLAGRYIKTVLDRDSLLLTIRTQDDIPPAPTPPAPIQGYAIASTLLSAANNITRITEAIRAADPMADPNEAVGRFEISVDGGPFVPVDLIETVANVAAITTTINTALGLLGSVTVDTSIEVVAGGPAYLKIISDHPGGSVRIRRATGNDISGLLGMGGDDGGLEVDGYAIQRPAPTGFFSRIGVGNPNTLTALSSFLQASVASVATLTVDDSVHDPASVMPAYIGTNMWGDGTTDLGESLRNGGQNLDAIASAINASDSIAWTAQRYGYRLVLVPEFGDANTDINASIDSNPSTIGANATGIFGNGPNVARYRLGSYPLPLGNYINANQGGDDGTIPALSDYTNAFNQVDREVDLFNLLILPRALVAPGQNDSARGALWGPASIFCQSRRAFLLIDPPEDWQVAQDILDRINGIEPLRRGLIKDHAAVYWSRLQIVDPVTGGQRIVDPAGAIAGVMARTDSNRGVWKAPAGLEADIRGVRGLQYAISDPENGLINPQAVNALRVFPNGIVSWGARTMDGFDNSGNDDYKYVPVRRIALFIEESLFRGLKFAVFEPNDEPLWAQIRLAAGAFMNNLFRQGAFQGQKARDAYFVKVDSETTTPNDINLGIVNVVVGFAPLKPAEFVVITIQQMAGQVQT